MSGAVCLIDSTYKFGFPVLKTSLVSRITDLKGFVFTPVVGIPGLWLWREEARRSFKIARVGPQSLEANIDPLVDLPASLKTPVCMRATEEFGNGYLLVKFHLPGGLKAGSVVPFEDGQRTLNRAGLCYIVAWTSLEYTCDNSTGQWIQSKGNFSTPFEPSSSCPDAGPDLEFVEALDITGCPATSVQQRIGPILVSFNLPGEEVAGSVVSFDSGYAYHGLNDICYSVSWNDHVFRCEDNGQWVQKSGMWGTPEMQCENGEKSISNGEQPYLEVNDGLTMFCPEESFEFINHPLYVRVTLPDGRSGNSTVVFQDGSAGRKVGETCSMIEWIPLEFECNQDSLEWIHTEGYVRGSAPLNCDWWDDGYGYVSNGNREFFEIIDTTVMTGCPAKQISYSSGPLQLVFDLPGNSLRGDIIDFTEGQINRGNCHAIGWSTHAFLCDPFSGEWKQTVGNHPFIQNFTDGCLSSGSFTINADQPFLLISDATTGASDGLSMPSPVANTISVAPGSSSPNTTSAAPVSSSPNTTSAAPVSSSPPTTPPISAAPVPAELVASQNATVPITVAPTGPTSPAPLPTQTPTTSPWFVPAVDPTSHQPSTVLPVSTNSPGNPSTTTMTTSPSSPVPLTTSNPTNSPWFVSNPGYPTTTTITTPSRPTKAPTTKKPTPLPSSAGPTPRPSYPRAPESTSFCGCPLCDKAKWDTMADSFTCGERIVWVLNSGVPILDACRQIAAVEHADACSACDPDTCDKTATNTPSLMPTMLSPSSSISSQPWPTFASSPTSETDAYSNDSSVATVREPAPSPLVKPFPTDPPIIDNLPGWSPEEAELEEESDAPPESLVASAGVAFLSNWGHECISFWATTTVLLSFFFINQHFE